MTEQELHRFALQKADEYLQRGFDAEAYLVKYVATKCIDKVPGSNIDEQIDDINQYFINYMKDKNENNLYIMLSHIRQMLSELYHTCEDEKQRTVFKNELLLFTNII